MNSPSLHLTPFNILRLRAIHSVRFLLKILIDCLIFLRLTFEVTSKPESPLSQKETLLIVNLQGIWDIVQQLSTIVELAKNPKIEITFLTRIQNAELLELIPNIKRLYLEPWFSGYLRTLFNLRKFKYTYACSLYRAEHWAFLVAFCRRHFPLGVLYSRAFFIPWKLLTFNFSIWNAQFWASELWKFFWVLDVPEFSLRSLLDLKSIQISKELLIRAQGPRVICIFTDNQWVSRSWGFSEWAKLIRKLLDLGFIIVHIGEKSSKNLTPQKINTQFSRQENFIDLVWNYTIPVVIGVLAQVKIFITTDSGPMHLAIESNVSKVVALFGPTWGDLSYIFESTSHIALVDQTSKIVWNHNNEPITNQSIDISVDSVLAAVLAI